MASGLYLTSPIKQDILKQKYLKRRFKTLSLCFGKGDLLMVFNFLLLYVMRFLVLRVVHTFTKKACFTITFKKLVTGG